MAQPDARQAIVCLGDLDLAWIEGLRALRLPKLGVHGNHDPPDLLREVEVDDLHMRRTSLGAPHVRGLRGLRRVRRRRPLPLHAAQGDTAREEAAGRRRPALPLPAARHQRRSRRPRAHRLRGPPRLGRPHRPRHILHGHTHPIAGLAQTRHERHARPLDQRRARRRAGLDHQPARRYSRTVSGANTAVSTAASPSTSSTSSRCRRAAHQPAQRGDEVRDRVDVDERLQPARQRRRARRRCCSGTRAGTAP